MVAVAVVARWVDVAQPGDFLFVHYSGHGTRLPVEIGDDDYIGYDECIVPCDFNPINGVGGGKWREVVVTSRRRWWSG
ncbi:hypothetical protein Hdeb2414_s0001g00021191 [Helianthus debilis subsp. tardiflorus]